MFKEECNDNGHVSLSTTRSQMGRRKRVLSTGNWMLSAEEEFYLRAAKIEGKLLCLSELLFFASIFASNTR
jgi:hypothetical protein